jgi:hypothetical protein
MVQGKDPVSAIARDYSFTKPQIDETLVLKCHYSLPGQQKEKQ